MPCEFLCLIVAVVDAKPRTRSSPENWHKVAELQLADVRDLQTFAIDDVTIFAKFLKLEAIDHHGNEFYCPIKYETAQSPYRSVVFKGGQMCVLRIIVSCLASCMFE